MKFKNQHQRRKIKKLIAQLTPEEKGVKLIEYYRAGSTFKMLSVLFDCDVELICDYLKQIDIRICTKCKQERSWSEFHRSNKTGGTENQCKFCKHEYRKKRYIEKEKDNTDVQLANRQWKEDNKELINERRRELNQTEEKKKKNRDYVRTRRHSDPIIRLRMNFSNLISYHLSQTTKNKVRKRRRHWEDIVGYTLSELKEHLEQQFQEGMTWDNYGKWHVDHKYPASLFQITSLECDEFKKCWDLQNLQPLWAEDNIRKSNKIGW